MFKANWIANLLFWCTALPVLWISSRLVVMKTYKAVAPYFLTFSIGIFVLILLLDASFFALLTLLVNLLLIALLNYFVLTSDKKHEQPRTLSVRARMIVHFALALLFILLVYLIQKLVKTMILPQSEKLISGDQLSPGQGLLLLGGLGLILLTTLVIDIYLVRRMQT